MLTRQEMGLTTLEYSELLSSSAQYLDFKVVASQYLHPFPAHPGLSSTINHLHYRRFDGASVHTYASFDQSTGNIGFVENGSIQYTLTDVPHASKTYVSFKRQGAAHLAAYLATTIEADLFVRTSPDAGSTWGSHTIAPPSGCSFVAMDASSTTRIHLVAQHLARNTYGFYVADWDGASWVLTGGDLWYWYPIRDMSVVSFNGFDIVAIQTELPGDFSADNLDFDTTAEKFWGAKDAIISFKYDPSQPFRRWGYHRTIESIPTYENADRLSGSKLSVINGQLYLHTIRTYGFESSTYLAVDEYQSFDGDYWSLAETVSTIPTFSHAIQRHHCPYLCFQNNQIYLVQDSSNPAPLAAPASPKYGYAVETFRHDISSWVTDLSIDRAEMVSADFTVSGAKDLIGTAIFSDRQMIYDIYFTYLFSTGAKDIKWVTLWQDAISLDFSASSFRAKITCRDKMHFITDRYKAQDFRVALPEDTVSLGVNIPTTYALLRGSGKQLESGFDIEASIADTSKDPLFAAVATENWYSWSLTWGQDSAPTGYGAFSAWDIVDGKNFWYYDRLTQKLTSLVNGTKSWESGVISNFMAVTEKYYASVKVLSYPSSELWVHLPYVLSKVSQKYIVGSSSATSGKFGFVVSRPLGGIVPIDPGTVISSRGWLITILSFHKFYSAFGRVQADSFTLQIDASAPPAVVNDSSITDVIYLTLDPDEAPLSGIQRAIDGRYILMWMRNNEKLKLWQHYNRSSVVSIHESEMLGSVSRQIDTRSLASHIRVLGAYVEAEYTDAALLDAYGDRFATEQNPYLMTEAECLFEAKEAARRMKERSETMSCSTRALIFLEPQDRVSVLSTETKPWVVDAYRLTATPGLLRQDFQMRQYVSGQGTIGYIPSYPGNLTVRWRWDFSQGRPPVTENEFIDSIGDYTGGMIVGIPDTDGSSWLSFDLNVDDYLSSFVLPAWFASSDGALTEVYFDGELAFTSTEGGPDEVTPHVWEGEPTYVEFIKVVMRHNGGPNSSVGTTGISLYKLPVVEPAELSPFDPPPYISGQRWCWDFMNGYAPNPPANIQSPGLIQLSVAGANNGPGTDEATARVLLNVGGFIGTVNTRTWFGNSTNCLTEILVNGVLVKTNSDGGTSLVTTSWEGDPISATSVEVRVKHTSVSNAFAGIRSVCIDPAGRVSYILIDFDTNMPTSITKGTLVSGEGRDGTTGLYTDYEYSGGHRYTCEFTIAIPPHAVVNAVKIWSRFVGSLQDIRMSLFDGASTTSIVPGYSAFVTSPYETWAQNTVIPDGTPIASGSLRVVIDYAAVNAWHTMWHYFDNMEVFIDKFGWTWAGTPDSLNNFESRMPPGWSYNLTSSHGASFYNIAHITPDYWYTKYIGGPSTEDQTVEIEFTFPSCELISVSVFMQFNGTPTYLSQCRLYIGDDTSPIEVIDLGASGTVAFTIPTGTNATKARIVGQVVQSYNFLGISSVAFTYR